MGWMVHHGWSSKTLNETSAVEPDKITLQMARQIIFNKKEKELEPKRHKNKILKKVHPLDCDIHRNLL